MWFRSWMKSIQGSAPNFILNLNLNLIVLCAALTVTPGCARLASLNTEPDPSGREEEQFAGRESNCLPKFSDQGGWLGGDAAYSIPLPSTGANTTLWLFGDSFVANQGSEPERRTPFIHNSIALSECTKDGTFEIEYI